MRQASRIVSVAMSALLSIWVGTTTRALMYFVPNKQEVTAVAWSPDGTHILSSGFDGTIRLWRADVCESGPFVYIDDPRIREGEDGYGPLLAGVMSVAWSPNGSRFAAGVRDRTVRFYGIDPDSPRGDIFDEIEVLSNEDMRGVRTVAYSQDGGMIASGEHDYAIRIWESKKHGSMVAEFKGHWDVVESVTSNSKGSTLFSGSRDGTVRVWDTSTKQQKQSLAAGGPVYSVALSPDNHLLAALAYPNDPNDFAISIWDTTTGEKVRSLGRKPSGTHLAFSPDGIHLASGGLESEVIRIWKIETGKSEHEVKIPDDRPVRGISYSPNGK